MEMLRSVSSFGQRSMDWMKIQFKLTHQVQVSPDENLEILQGIELKEV